VLFAASAVVVLLLMLYIDGAVGVDDVSVDVVCVVGAMRGWGGCGVDVAAVVDVDVAGVAVVVCVGDCVVAGCVAVLVAALVVIVADFAVWCYGWCCLYS